MAQTRLKGVAVVGGGPAGLAAALAAARGGSEVLLIDENNAPGGQLRKQIHKFFGSKAHRAGIRGYRIAEELTAACQNAGVQFAKDAIVFSLEKNEIGLMGKDGVSMLRADAIVLATGANEKAVAFPGCTLPGVMGAGAAQTFTNLHRVLPGRKILMIGGGNVGLIVSYQLLQAGADVVGVVESTPRLSGYRVHAAKLMRAGIPIWLSHAVIKADGNGQVQEAVIAAVDSKCQPIAGSERTILVDTICLAVGLSPLTELAWQAGCTLSYDTVLGGHVPVHSSCMETTVPGLYVAGDVAGVEEASTALEEGTIAGLAACASVGCNVQPSLLEDAQQRLQALRYGPFGQMRKLAKGNLIKRWTECHINQ